MDESREKLKTESKHTKTDHARHVRPNATVSTIVILSTAAAAAGAPTISRQSAHYYRHSLRQTDYTLHSTQSTPVNDQLLLNCSPNYILEHFLCSPLLLLLLCSASFYDSDIPSSSVLEATPINNNNNNQQFSLSAFVLSTRTLHRGALFDVTCFITYRSSPLCIKLGPVPYILTTQWIVFSLITLGAASTETSQ